MRRTSLFILLVVAALANSGCFGLTARVATIGTTTYASEVEVTLPAMLAHIQINEKQPYYSIAAPVFDSTYRQKQTKSFDVSIKATPHAGIYALDLEHAQSRTARNDSTVNM